MSSPSRGVLGLESRDHALIEPPDASLIPPTPLAKGGEFNFPSGERFPDTLKLVPFGLRLDARP